MRLMQHHNLWRRLANAAALLLVIGTFIAAAGKPEGFHLDRLPTGKNVTIPRPATTFVPLSVRVTLTSTDMPQSVSFRPVNNKGGAVQAIRLAIYDNGSTQARYVNLQPGTPFLYSYKTISSITVVPEVAGSVKSDGLELQVESDKPLDLGK